MDADSVNLIVRFARRSGNYVSVFPANIGGCLIAFENIQLRAQSKLEAARGLLSPIYGCFTEGFDTPDVKDAKASLDRLAPT